MDSINQPTLSLRKSKSIFESKTFWGATLTAIAAIAPIVGDAVEEGKLSVDRTVNIVVVLATTGATLAGRLQADSEVYTPDWAPGPNKPEADRTQS